MHHYPFHIGDYAAHTRNLSLMEDLAYRRLLDAYYLAERPLDGCATEVARSIGMREHQDEVGYVLSKFFVKTDAGWVNARADAEIERFKAKSEQASRAGKASAERRQIARSTSVEKNPTGVQPTKNQEPEPSPSLRSGDKPPRKRAAPPPPKPDDVDQQTWDDWLQLRKAKSAPVTETVLRGARSEAEAAGMDLDAFLQVWCLRGSQGLQADWLRPDERKTPSRVRYPAETPYQAQQLAQAQALAPTAARRSAGAPQDFIDLEEMSHVHVHGIEGH